MSSAKTPNLNMHSWSATDGVKRTEFNDNFTTLDTKAKALDDKDASLQLQVSGALNTLDDAKMGADGTARASVGALVREIHTQQIDAAWQSVTLKRGTNVI